MFWLLRQLRALCDHVALDEIGIGYSPLSGSHELAIDRIEICAGFVADFGRRRETASIAEAINALTRSLGLEATVGAGELEVQFETPGKMSRAEVQASCSARLASRWKTAGDKPPPIGRTAIWRASASFGLRRHEH